MFLKTLIQNLVCDILEDDKNLTESHRPEYIPGKGLKFVRYGGLTPRKQKNAKAPYSKGLWAFVFPYFDAWFLSGEFSDIEGRFTKDGKLNRNLIKHFYYDGPIFTKINVPGSTEVNGWALTTTRDLADYLPKVYSSDVAQMRKGYTSNYGEKRIQDLDHDYMLKVNKNPYNMGMSTDHFEVFIPAKSFNRAISQEQDLEEINAIGTGVVVGYTLPLGMKPDHKKFGLGKTKRKSKQNRWYEQDVQINEQVNVHGSFDWKHAEPKDADTSKELLQMYKVLTQEKIPLGYNPSGVPSKTVAGISRGSWSPLNYIQNSIVFLYPETKTIEIKTNLNDPRLASILSSSRKWIPGFDEYVVSKHHHNDEVETFGTVFDLVNKIKKTKIKSKKWSDKSDDTPTYEEFEFEVLQDVSERPWYHTTKLSNLKSIASKGLLPSKEFEQGSGWTQLNLNLQNAVYLTADKNYALDIGETLLGRFNEPSIVLQISGDALKNTENLVIDEDSLIDEYTGTVAGGKFVWGLPDYMTSVVDKIESLGYEGKINPTYIKPLYVLDAEYEKDENDNITDANAMVYSWNEWKQKNKIPNIIENKKRILDDEDDEENRGPQVETPFEYFEPTDHDMDVFDIFITKMDPGYKLGKVQTIDLHDPNLFATQRFVDVNTMEKQKTGEWKGSSEYPIVIDYFDGRKFIQDGHHRLSAQKLAGKKKAKAYVIPRTADYNGDLFETLCKIECMSEEYLGKKGGVRYFQMGGSLPDNLYNLDNKGKPTRDPGVPGVKKSKSVKRKK